MPGTINGIGTMYYGKKNLQTHFGVCEHCHNQGELASYETRLWFVFLFIPVIPLGKKQIIDYCRVCTHGGALPVREWKRVEQQATREAMQQADRDPTDPNAAVELHGTLVAFQRREEAARLAEIMGRNFADNAEVQVYLGSWYAVQGEDARSDACFANALQLEPDNLAAKRGVAVGLIEKGDLAKARELLSFMETPGPDQDPAVLVLLANAYQAKGDHDSALAVYQIVLGSHPSLGRDKHLRKRVKSSERALGKTASALPKVRLTQRPAFLFSALGLVVVVVVIGINQYIARHQDLHVVNRLPVAVTVTIDGDLRRTVASGGRVKVPLAEGKHQAVTSTKDGGEETVDFRMGNGFFERFFSDTVFVLNVRGAASFLWQQITYTPVPDPNRQNPYEIRFGERFLVFRDVDYAFQAAPQRLTTESKLVTKTCVSVLDFEPAEILAGFPEDTPIDNRLRFAEHHLTLNPNDENLLRSYYVLSVGAGQANQCVLFLEKELDRRPVLIEWHLTYQEACRAAGGEEAMVARYDRMLAEAPGDSAVLCLKGRITASSKEATQFYDRAIAADPKNPYPHFAKSCHLAHQGQLAAARQACAEASRLKGEDFGMESLLFEIRFALSEYAALEAELKAAQAKDPLNLSVQQRLLQVLAAGGKMPQARQAHQAYARRVRSPQDPTELALYSQLTLQDLQGDMEGCLRTSRRLKDATTADEAAFNAHLELGNLEQAEKLLSDATFEHTGYLALLLTLAWRQQGDREKADSWRQKAVEVFQAGTREEKRVAALLLKGDELVMEEVDDVTPRRVVGAALFIVLADSCESNRDELLKRAEKLNRVNLFPQRFLRRAIAAVRG